MKSTRLLQAVLLSGALMIPAAAQTSGTQSGQPGQTSGTQSGQTSGSQTGQSDSRTTGQTGSDQHSGHTAAGQQSTTDHTGHVAGAAGASDNESRVGTGDRQFMMKAAQSGMMEVQLAKMAQEKASSDEVKQYARQLEQDHMKANEQLKEIAQRRGVDLPSDAGKHDQQMSKLQNLSGDQFDRAFMRHQVQHHKKDLKEFQRQANRSMDSAVKEFAQSQVPVLEGHLRQAQQLTSSTGTRSRSSNMDNNTSQGSTTAGQEGSSSTDRRNNQ